MSEYPQKEFYKLNEVCRYTDTQPYVLRFWESEFPQLNPERRGSGQPVYRKEDIDLVHRIKQLLYEDECSLEVARQELDKQPKPSAGRPSGRKVAETSPEPASSASAVGKLRRDAGNGPARLPSEPEESLHRAPDLDGVPRERYQDAVEEVNHLRLQLKEAENARDKAENSLREATEAGELHRLKAARAGDRIEELLDSLS